ncbi:MAG: protoporphyrinogen oxidase [Blastocatellia bacterium]|nr:protoporphyrinogen oxidase [Blastocatellia bacterium]
MRKKVAIIGGGISGLCVAHQLLKGGFDLTLFESGSSVGGNIKTETRDGFLFEHGPNTALASLELLDLISELGLDDKLAAPKPSSNKRFILRDGGLVQLPSSLFGFARTAAFSRRSKFRLLKEPFVAAKVGDEESVAAFFERRLGREVVDYAVDPFISGIYAGDPDKLAIRHAFPRIYELEKRYGSLLKGAVFSRRKGSAKLPKGTPRSITFKQGMQVLTDALAAELGGSIKLNANVRAIRKSDVGRIEVETPSGLELFDAIVVCAPAHSTGKLIRSLDEEAALALEAIYYPPVTVVVMGFHHDQVRIDPSGFGFLVPALERRNILGSLWTSSVFENRAPLGYHLFTTFIGGSRNPELCDEEEGRLAEIALEELNAILGISGDPVITVVKKWKRAIPQYNIGYDRVLNALDRFRNSHERIFFCSNYYKGISVSDCVKNGLSTGNEVFDCLTR